jgi:hypothetical protein
MSQFNLREVCSELRVVGSMCIFVEDRAIGNTCDHVMSDSTDRHQYGQLVRCINGRCGRHLLKNGMFPNQLRWLSIAKILSLIQPNVTRR